MARRIATLSSRLGPIGFGAFKIGRNQGIKYEQGYSLPDEEDAARLLNGILDMGITYIDTAPAYGLSEERIGRHLSHRREEFVLSTKVGETFEDGRSSYDFSGPATADSVHRSLRRLQTDILDMVLIHSNGDDTTILQGDEPRATLQRLKDTGDIRAIGFSGKTVAGATLACAWADALMVEYHLEDRSHEALMETAAEAGVAVIVKKGLASGRLSPQQSIRFVLGNSSVSSLVVGSLSLDHLASNLEIARSLTAGSG